MAIIATVISAIQKKNKAKIEVSFDDGKMVWHKTYTLEQTEPMKFADFKDMVAADIRRDLKVNVQLINIDAQVGKTFTITV